MEKIQFNRVSILEFSFGTLNTNCYILSSSSEVVVIDPSSYYPDEKEMLYKEILKLGDLKYILNTHGHFDHISGNSYLKSKFKDSLIGIERNDSKSLTDPVLNYSSMLQEKVISEPEDFSLEDNSTVSFGESSLKVIHTPGHTKGSVSLLGEGFIFTGDTLFAGSVGIAKEYNGAFEELINSIKSKLLVLPFNTIIFPGHGEESTIGEEAQLNPFLNN